MEWRKNEVVGTTYGLSTKGWVDSELFRGWLSEHFLAHAVGAQPLLSLLDGHSSYYQPELITYAREFGIVIFCLSSDTTHESQPLDASVFKSLKQNWQHTCHKFIQSNHSLAVTKYHFQGYLVKHGENNESSNYMFRISEMWCLPNESRCHRL